MAKCEKCYHAGVCIHRINYEDYDCECANYKDKSFIAELPCRVGDDLYWISISEENEVKCHRNAIVGIVVKDSGFEVLDTDGNIDKIGTRYAYLTREEAERALEEINNEKNNN